MDYNIYCVSNAGSNTDVKNTLNSFTNLFPQNLDLKNREWEIGIVSMGLHYNYNQLTMTKGQIGVITLKNELTLWKIFEIESLQSRKLFVTNLSECSLPKFMDNGFGESNCCPSGVPNSLVYGLQFVVQSGIVTPAWTD